MTGCSYAARLFGLLVALTCLAPPLLARATAAVRVESLDGRAIDPLQLPADVKAAVYIFVSVDCPVSNRYAPEVRRLHDRFAAQGVRFTLVYPNPAETPAAIREHLTAYAYPPDAVRDVTHTLVKHAGITITPEVAVFTRGGQLAYRGRIDDRYVTLGLERPAATTHDLADALTNVLAGTPVRQPRTQAVGCYVADFVR